MHYRFGHIRRFSELSRTWIINNVYVEATIDEDKIALSDAKLLLS